MRGAGEHEFARLDLHRGLDLSSQPTQQSVLALGEAGHHLFLHRDPLLVLSPVLSLHLHLVGAAPAPVPKPPLEMRVSRSISAGVLLTAPLFYVPARHSEN